VTSGGTAKCSASYAISSSWGNGFNANVTVNNTGTSATKTWKVTWTWGGNQSIVNSWNAVVASSGTSVTANSASYNGAIAGGGNTSFGFQASFSGTNTNPTLTCSAT
jgi:cellulose 1,4-beta-cellobiosidase